MSEWFKREDRKPPKGVVVVHTDGENYWTVKDICHNDWDYWMPLPALPPRMVTIEISEDDARSFVTDYFAHDSPRGRLAEACAEALEAKR